MFFRGRDDPAMTKAMYHRITWTPGQLQDKCFLRLVILRYADVILRDG